jgi:hypothetical protein
VTCNAQQTTLHHTLTSTPDVRQVTSCPSSTIGLFYSTSVFPCNRIWRKFELLTQALSPVSLLHDALLLLLLLRPLLRGGRVL